MTDELTDLVRELVLEMKGLRADLAQQRAPSGQDVDFAKHLAVIAAAVENTVFSTPELVTHAALPQAHELRISLKVIAGAVNARKIGKMLRSIEGQEIGGLRVERVGQDRDGVLWALRVCRKPAKTVAKR